MPWNPSNSWKPGTTFEVCRWLIVYTVGYYRLIDRLSVWIVFRQSGQIWVQGAPVHTRVPRIYWNGAWMWCGMWKDGDFGPCDVQLDTGKVVHCTSWQFAENIPFIPLELECLCHEWHILIWLTHYDHFVIILFLLYPGFIHFTCRDSTDLTADLTSKVSAVTLQENASDGNMVTVSWHLSRWALRRPCVSLVMLTLRLSTNCVTWRMATQIEQCLMHPDVSWW